MFKKLKYPFVLCLAVGFIINTIIEILGRKNPATYFVQIYSSTLSFLFDWLFISLTLCLSLFFRRKYFVLSIISTVWLTLGVVNAYVLSYRTNPLCAIDFSILQISWNFIGLYTNKTQIFLLLILAIALVLGLIYIFRKAPKTEIKLKPALIEVCILVSVITVLMTDFLGLGIPVRKLTDLKESYSKYGFVYCFFRGTVERGVTKPQDYSNIQVEELKDSLDEIETEDPEVKPNIIFVQLESFFDTNLLNDYKFSENPVPTFSSLKSSYPHGELFVPTTGAGTANTEFEIITQQDLDFFGTGEYPYKTALKSRSCETVPYDLSELGYRTFAVHDNNATFYDRNQIFSKFGFNNFITSEFMGDVTKNPEGWINDVCLVPQIRKCLDSTLRSDYIYTISVQGHGAYPTESYPDNKIKLISSPDNSTLNNQVEYYANQINGSDQFISQLIDMVEKRNEPTVIVFYGDHMPSLNLETNDLLFGDLFRTEYVIWNNLGLRYSNRDIEAYQLSSYVLNMLDINNGYMTKLNQTSYADSDYLDKLRLAEYDVFYGSRILYGGKDKYVNNQMKMGIDNISISNVQSDNDCITISGVNFTSSSYVFINGKKYTPESQSDESLIVKYDSLKDNDLVDVRQISDDGVVLSTTDVYVYKSGG
jgi:hypothetical protein